MNDEDSNIKELILAIESIATEIDTINNNLELINHTLGTIEKDNKQIAYLMQFLPGA